MPTVIRLGEKKPERRTVPVPGLDGCSLVVREPTTAELLNQWIESQANPPQDRSVDNGKLFEYRLRVVVDWSGFVDQHGNTLQFNPVTFAVAIRQVDGLMDAAWRISREAFEGLPEQDEKNSGTPHSDGSLDAATATATAE